MADHCTNCGMRQEEHEFPLQTGSCFAYSLLPRPAAQASPFPPEVVETNSLKRGIESAERHCADWPQWRKNAAAAEFGFPEKVADRVRNQYSEIRYPCSHMAFDAGKEAALSVVADYLRSEEARERVAQWLYEQNDWLIPWPGVNEDTRAHWLRRSDAVISALLGEKG